MTTSTKKRQVSILTFSVETPCYAVTHRPSPPTKRSLAVKRGPGRPRNIRRQEDWTQVWYDAVDRESKRSSLLRVCESRSSYRPVEHPFGQIERPCKLENGMFNELGRNKYVVQVIRTFE